MSGHVWSWIAGYGWTLMPYAPFRFERVDGRPRTARVQHFSADGTREATVTITENDEPEWELGPGTEELQQVVDLLPCDEVDYWNTGDVDSWLIQTTVLTSSWPEGFAAESTVAAPPFDLVGPDDARIWIRGPVSIRKLPPLEQMTAPGQTLVEVVITPAGPMVELSYEHEGSSWRQFLCEVGRCDPPRRGPLAILQRLRPRYMVVVSGQVRETDVERLRGAVVEVATSLITVYPGAIGRPA